MRGITLIDVLVGSALLVLVFVGLFTAYQLGLKMLHQSQDRIVATAIANEYIEQARNLSYAQIGIQGGYPEGVLEASQDVVRNGKTYTVVLDVDYVADVADGLAAPEDPCLNDYKRIVATVSWEGKFPDAISLGTDIAPKNVIQECEETGGMIDFNVFGALGQSIIGALISVQDIVSTVTDQCVTGVNGNCQILLPTSLVQGENYKITVQKTGYSSVETFTAGDTYQGSVIATPERSHATVLEGEITEISFSIDQTSSFTIATRSSRGRNDFQDPFDNVSYIAEFQDVEVENGSLQLEETGGIFDPSGYALSQSIGNSVLSWGQVSFVSSIPQNTTLTIQVLYFDGIDWVLIPENDLLGNAAGFSISPLNLSSLSASLYPAVRVQANLTTTDNTVSPRIDEWILSYFTQQDFPIGNVSFDIQGAKEVGKNVGEQSIFKYQASHNTNGSGSITLTDLEWDGYTITVTEFGLGLVEIDPEPQPVVLNPNTNGSVTLYLEAQQSLLVAVQDSQSAAPVFSATVIVEKAGFESSQITDGNGQTLFIPLDQDTYTISVEAAGYDSFEDTVAISGNNSIDISLVQNPE
jgi:hypothetical protein